MIFTKNNATNEPGVIRISLSSSRSQCELVILSGLVRKKRTDFSANPKGCGLNSLSI
uniref:Uncharacterized protein n=1 Tax=Arundo donax TaxID=35708 RepID=A0A0A8YVM7_ARUDO